MNIKKLATLFARQFANLQAGSVGAMTVNKNTYQDFTVTFDHAFDSTPVVVVGLVSGSTGYGSGNLSVSVISASTTGFTGRVFNADGTSNSRSPALRWIAMNKI